MSDESRERRLAGSLEVERLRWLIVDEFEHFLRAFDEDPLKPEQELRAFVLPWFAVSLPLLFTSEIEGRIRDALRERVGDENYSVRGWYRLLPVHAACFAISGDRSEIDVAVANINHHNSDLRPPVYRSLALVVDALSFHDQDLRLRVESCLGHRLTGAEDAALLLLTAHGDVDEKRRWAGSQLVLHGVQSPKVTRVLEAARDGAVIPNTLLGPLAEIAFYVMSRLATSGGHLPFPGAGGRAEDWAQADVFRLGDEMWPQLFFGAMQAHPLLRAWIDLEERGISDI